MGHGPEDYVAGYKDAWDLEQDRKKEAAEKERSTPKQCDNFRGREHKAHLWYDAAIRADGSRSYAAPAEARPVHWCSGIHPETEIWKGRVIRFHQDGKVTWRKVKKNG